MQMIYHHPLPFKPESRAASGIRPLRMLKAFQDVGYEVDLVVGYGKERKKAIKHIKNKIKEGVKYDFVYSESSTMPTTLTETHHLPFYPFMDWRFFRFCNKQNIPVGLFYRDIYWLFEDYDKRVHPAKSFVAKIAYRFDLWVYEKTVDKVFLPSLEMADYVPKITKDKFSFLPPGHQSPVFVSKEFTGVVNLFYVGGVTNHYNLDLLLKVVKDYPQIKFTLCTREEEWLSIEGNYPILGSNVTIIHETGEIMEQYLQECDIAVLFVKPEEYWSFASPVKLYEYLGFEKPVLASNGTLAGQFVEKNKIGWSIDYDESSLRKFFDKLILNEVSINDVKESLRRVAKKHTWNARAEQVVEELLLSK